MIRSLFCLIVIALFCLSPSTVDAQTGRSPKIITFGAERAAIKNTHILHRPNRPLHFYGNTVRRIHYRGRRR